MSKMLNQYLDSDYQEICVKKWAPVLEAAGDIQNDYTKIATAMVLESTERTLSESAMGATDTGFQSGLGDANLGLSDARIPSIVIPTVRRIFPDLLAHDCVGVQPMSGPVGFAFALRFQYGLSNDGAGGTTAAPVYPAGHPRAGQPVEIGYNSVLSGHSGVAGTNQATDGLFTKTALTAILSTTADDTLVAGYASETLTPAEITDLMENVSATGRVEIEQATAWNSFAGATGSQSLYKGQVNPWGAGSAVGDSEFWGLGQADGMPEINFDMKKGAVEAKTRKIGTSWSLELAEDMKNMHGIDVEAEMVNTSSYEIQAQIDRQLLQEMVKAAISGARISSWSPVTADGRNQIERIGTFYTHVLDKSNDIAVTTRRAPGNFLITSPKVCALMERIADFKDDAFGGAKIDTKNIGVSKVGTIRNGGMKVYRDTLAGGNYALIGYKGSTPYDAGIIYCPYIPVQVMKAQDPYTFAPKMGVRTRYGVLNHQFGADLYYHMIQVEDLTGVEVPGSAQSGRVFTR